jgi:hypothetical protein
MSTLKADTVTTKSDNTDLTLTGGGTGVPNLEAGFKVGGSAGVPTASIQDDAVTLAKLAAGTDGELITWDASGDPATVAVGTATHILTSNGAGAAPTFQAAAGGGAWELIATGTPSSSTYLTFTGFDSSTYNNYLFLVAGVTNAGTHSEHRFRMWSSTDGGSSYDDGSNDYSYGKRMQSNSSDNGAQSATSNEIEFCGGIDTTGSGADGIATGFVQIPNPQATDTRVRFLFDMTIGDAATKIYNVNGMYLRDANADVDAIRFGWLSEDFADQGAIYFYGMKKT